MNIAETLAAAEAAAQIAAAAGGANTPEAKSALSRLFNFTQNMSLPPNSGMDIFSGDLFCQISRVFANNF